MTRSKPSQSILTKPVRYLKGVGPKRAEKLGNLGIESIRDFLFHLPRSYEDRREAVPIHELEEGQEAVVCGEIIETEFRPTRNPRRGILVVKVADDSGIISLTWFHATHGWLKSFPENKKISAFGQLKFYRGTPQMVAPDYALGVTPEESTKFGAILPIYPSTEGLNQKRLREFTRASLEMAASQIKDVVPQNLRAQRDIPPISETLWNVHFPPDKESAQKARYRLAYEELLVFQSALAIHRQHVKQADGYQFKIGPNVDKRIRRLFPFEFTDAQKRVIDEIRSDMSSANPMNRLLQGDVGCGKTAVAVYALLGALAESSKGYQTALMAPTEVLAEQHYLTLESLLEKADVRTMLLSGRSSPAERRSHLKDIASGRVDLVVGTHALIQEDVDFKNLSMIVVDEQHRFGVEQRLTLKEKGTRPDVLIMTATPIPRTLAVACFGDMDVSTIDEMPPGRKKTETHVFSPYRWQKAFETARSRLEKGERLFVVYPLVEENEQIDLTSATEGYEKLSAGLFSNYECCLIHGQMTPEKKRDAMAGFREGRYEVMVATTVIEVGVDVPEASVMIIQHAERLGLAQLHQLRGRIGRGESEGLCFLLAEPSTEEAKQRLQVLSETDDGFEIAEADLRIRGPGKLFGTEQSGMPEFRCYDFSDPEVLEQARKDAFRIVEQDPQLEASGHVLLRKAVLKRYSNRMVLGSVG